MNKKDYLIPLVKAFCYMPNVLMAFDDPEEGTNGEGMNIRTLGGATYLDD